MLFGWLLPFHELALAIRDYLGRLVVWLSAEVILLFVWKQESDVRLLEEVGGVWIGHPHILAYGLPVLFVANCLE